MMPHTLAKNASLVTLIIILALMGATLATPATKRTHAQQVGSTPKLDVSNLRAKARHESGVRLIVGVNTSFQPEGTLASTQAVRNQRSRIRRAQQSVLSSLPAAAAQTAYQFEFIPFMGLRADTATLDALAQNPMVTSIEEDVPVASQMNESIPLIGIDNAHNDGYTGDGFAVAVIDSGVDKNHEFLQGSVISEACYSTTDAVFQSTTVCPDGVFESTASDSGAPCLADGCDHGTHVAGIVAGRNGPAGLTGVAPEASLIAIQVFSSILDSTVCGSDPLPCSRSYILDQIRGLERVHALHIDANFDTPIAAVNMSLGGSRYDDQATCDREQSSRKAAIDTLAADNIAVIVASGNAGYTDSIAAPACISSAVSVGAVGDGTSGYSFPADEVPSFSNSADFLDLLAPGVLIESAEPGIGTYSLRGGTSMAAPHVAGAWAILLQKDPDATLAELLTILKNTGVAVTDTRAGANSRATPRIQVDAALSVLNEAPVITQGISTTVTMSEDGSPTDFELELNASDADNDPLTWSISSDPDHGSATISDGAGMAEEISYIPDADYVGSDSFDVQVSDEDGDTDTITVNVTMQAVNDAPTFTRGPDVVVPITSTAQTVPQWANNIRPGPASASDELSQTLTFTLEVTSTTGSLAFATDPAIDPSSGDLTFQATAGTTGTATVLVRLRDSGPGTTPHSNTSLAEQFRIIVGQDVPSGNIDDIVVYVNAADTVINLYDAFSDPNDADADLSFAVHKNTNASLVGTSIDTSAGTLTLQYVSGSRGTATITVRATDPDGNYADAVFRVTVVQGLNVYIPLVVR